MEIEIEIEFGFDKVYVYIDTYMCTYILYIPDRPKADIS